MLITIRAHRGKNFDDISVGDEVILKKSPGAISESLIDCYHEGNSVGFVVNSTNMLVTGTELSSNIINKVPDSFKGVVKEKTVKVLTNAKAVLVVDISSTGSGISSSSKDEIFTFKVAGSSSQNPKKIEIISESAKGKDIYVTFTLSNGKIVAMYEGEQAGVVSVKNESGYSTQEEREIFSQILEESTSPVEGKVLCPKEKTGSFYVVQCSISKNSLEEAKVASTKKAVGGVKQPLIDKGFEEEVLNNIENYLLDNGFKADDIVEIFNTYQVCPDKYKHLVPKSLDRVYKDKNKDMLYDAYSAIACNEHILCSGEKGTGKNVFIETWAWILQRPLFAISINRDTEKMDLVGSNIIEPKTVVTSKGEESVVSTIEFQEEVLLEAMKVGGIINIDEINFADPGVTGLLHSVGDSRRELFVPGYGHLKAHENFIIMATMNVGYQGTNDLNEALADRFVDIRFENNDSIFHILEEVCPELPKSSLMTCDKIYEKIITSIREAEATFDESCITVRGFIQALKMSKKIPLKRALFRAVADKVKDESYREALTELIENLA